MRVFLTGGTGLVGSHVAERLAREGHAVRALVRRSAQTRHLRSVGAELVTGDVTDPSTLVGAMRGCEAVVHSAAAVTVEAPWEVYHEVNVLGTANVLSAAAEQGVQRAVHVSTVAVYGGAEVARWDRVDESTSTDSPLGREQFYGRSKRGAEVAAQRVEQEVRLQVTVVRPDVIYGERDRAALPRLARYVSQPLVLLVGSGRNELPLVYAGNVAQGIVRALSGPRPPGRVYNLANDFPITQRGFFELLAVHLGRRPRFMSIPVTLATAIAGSFEALTRLRGVRRPVVSRRHVAFMGHGNPFVSDLAKAELPWEPEFTHEDGVRRSVEWYLEERRGVG